MNQFQSFEKFLNEGINYAVMLIGGSIGDKPRPRDAKGYAGMDVDKDEWLTDLNNAKAKAKRMNDNLSPGEKKHYGLKYVVVPVKNKKFIKESIVIEYEMNEEKAIKDLSGKNEKPMVTGIAKIIKRVVDPVNRKEMVDSQIEDFKEEGIYFDYEEFKKLCDVK